MNGLDKITSRIADEARGEADRIIKEAEASAAAIAQDYAVRAKAEYDSKMAAGSELAAQDADRTERAARLDARKDILTLKQELIGKAYDTARAQILSMDDKAYTSFLADKAGNAAVTGKEQIILNPADAERIGAAVVSEANRIAGARGIDATMLLSTERRDICGGVILKDGNIEVNCSLDKLLEMARGEMDAVIAGILF